MKKSPLDKLNYVFILTTIIVLALFSFTVKTGKISAQQSNPWVAPECANTIKNPVKGDESATTQGEKLFNQLCAICHGNKGKGDGMAGMSLNPRPSDLTSKNVQTQTDGAIYWKITEGRPPMASYKESLSNEKRNLGRWKLQKTHLPS